jgi:hypothetical protein
MINRIRTNDLIHPDHPEKSCHPVQKTNHYFEQKETKTTKKTTVKKVFFVPFVTFCSKNRTIKTPTNYHKILFTQSH